MSQRAVQKRLEQALAEKDQPRPRQQATLWDMVSFSDLEDLMIRSCRNPTNRVAVGHYVRWMRELAGRWTAEETLLELLAVFAIAAERPRSEEIAMT